MISSRKFFQGRQVLCPCRSCINREQQTLDNVEAHLLMNGMASTYDRWIHHGEPLHAPQPEHVQPDGEAHHVDHQGADFVEGDPLFNDGFEEETGMKMIEFLTFSGICTS